MTDSFKAFLEQPMWQGMGGLIALLAIVVTIWVSRRPVKKLDYSLGANSPVLGQHATQFGDLQLTYKGQPVKDARLVVLRFSQSGNTPITAADFHEPIKVRFNEGAHLYSLNFEDASPAELAPSFVNVANDGFGIAACLLNPQDRFSVKMLVSGYKSVSVSARIVGVRKLSTPDEIGTPSVLDKLAGAAASISILTAICSWLLRTAADVHILVNGWIIPAAFAGACLALDIIQTAARKVLRPRA